MAQMVQRTLVSGGPAGLGEKTVVPEVSGGWSDRVESAEKKLPKLFSREACHPLWIIGERFI